MSMSNNNYRYNYIIITPSNNFSWLFSSLGIIIIIINLFILRRIKKIVHSKTIYSLHLFHLNTGFLCLYESFQLNLMISGQSVARGWVTRVSDWPTLVCRSLSVRPLCHSADGFSMPNTCQRSRTIHLTSTIATKSLYGLSSTTRVSYYRDLLWNADRSVFVWA